MKTITKTFGLIFKTLFLLLLVSSCEKEDLKESLDITAPNLETASSDFDFDNFGRAHNAYLEYVYQIDDRDNPRARFDYGKTYVDPVFGSFDVGLKYEDIDRAMPMHLRRVEAILNGSYRADSEPLNPEMVRFLARLAQTVKNASDSNVTLAEFEILLEDLAAEVRQSNEIQIDMATGKSNDGASMLAITSILKYSIAYWIDFEGGGQGDVQRIGGKIWRALADAWGYVSAWTDNGDGSYSWDHGSALVNADCVSDKVREN